MGQKFSLKTGSSVAERVILQATDAQDPTADPTVVTQGHNLQNADFVHIYAELGGTITAAQVTPWYWSNSAGQWFEGDPISFSATTKFALEEVRSEDRLFLVIDSITGTGTLRLWADYSYEGRDS